MPLIVGFVEILVQGSWFILTHTYSLGSRLIFGKPKTNEEKLLEQTNKLQQQVDNIENLLKTQQCKLERRNSI